MTRLLAIDTSGEACSAALLLGDVVSERIDFTQREHGPKVLAMVDELLAEGRVELAELDAIAFGRGPGSFTGLRIAAGVTQGLALGAGLKVAPVSSLAMLAQGLMDEGLADAVAVCLDARMNEAYAGFFQRCESGEAVAIGEEVLISPADLALPKGEQNWVAAGSGWAAFDSLATRLGVAPEPGERPRPTLARHALKLAKLALRSGTLLSVEQALPVYLREKVAWQK